MTSKEGRPRQPKPAAIVRGIDAASNFIKDHPDFSRRAFFVSAAGLITTATYLIARRPFLNFLRAQAEDQWREAAYPNEFEASIPDEHNLIINATAHLMKIEATNQAAWMSLRSLFDQDKLEPYYFTFIFLEEHMDQDFQASVLERSREFRASQVRDRQEKVWTTRIGPFPEDFLELDAEQKLAHISLREIEYSAHIYAIYETTQYNPGPYDSDFKLSNELIGHYMNSLQTGELPKLVTIRLPQYIDPRDF